MAHSVRIGAKGRVVLPAALRAQTGASEGDELIASAEGGRIILETSGAIKARLRAAAMAARSDGKVVDRLLADRKADLEMEGRPAKTTRGRPH